MAPPSFYDPSSPEEQPVSLPSAPPILVSENVVLQPPLTRRGGLGPILILLLPPKSTYAQRDPTTEKPLDPEPVQKWAEEGFSVIGVTVVDQLKIQEYIDSGLHAFFVLSNGGKELASVDLPALRVDAAIIGMFGSQPTCFRVLMGYCYSIREVFRVLGLWQTSCNSR